MKSEDIFETKIGYRTESIAVESIMRFASGLRMNWFIINENKESTSALSCGVSVQTHFLNSVGIVSLIYLPTTNSRIQKM